MKLLEASAFLERVSSVETFNEFKDLRKESLETENFYREIFARQRDGWEVPEVDDPLLFLVNVFENSHIFRKLPDFPEDTIPRCFELQAKIPVGAPSTVSLTDFQISWECFTEGLLRFVNWDNVFCAGGAVAGCLTPLPEEIQEASPSKTRVMRRKYFHDQFLPSSDIDLFLFGLDEPAAVEKLREIYDAIQASSPYEIRAFRSAHAVTLVSRYPFRHVQIVLRLYNSPSEILMGFDVDSCAVGYDGKHVYMCPRTALAFISQTNTVDMTRRSPSYEMRLAKYAQRGFEILVDGLNRDRVDPFLYERRFDQNNGLSRLLMLERLRTPEERLRYRIQGTLEKKTSDWVIQRKIRKLAGDLRNIERVEGNESIVPNVDSGPEASNYSTVFLPWGPMWTVDKIERMTKKKDKILNAIEFLPDGRVVANRKNYKIHVCAVGTMDEILVDPYPDDPPVPEDVLEDVFDGTVRGPLTWIVDNPGRQQIGSFHPVTNADWTEGAYISTATEALILAANANDTVKLTELLSDDDGKLLHSRDFLGRTALHVAALAESADACSILLEQPGADAAFIQARLADGRTALHISAMRGNVEISTLILNRRNSLITHLIEKGMERNDAILEVLDIDCSDWNVKMSPMHYAIVFGYLGIVRLLLSAEYGANARKVAVHKDENKSLSAFDLLALYAGESGKSMDLSVVREIAKILITAGASAAQVDTSGSTAWHTFAACCRPSSISAFKTVLELHAEHNNGKVIGIDILDSSSQTPLYIATACGNFEAIMLLLKAGAAATFSEEVWEARVQKVRESALYGGRSNSFYVPQDLGDGIKRCPVFVAAANADARCLSALVSYDRSMANAVIRIPKSIENYWQQKEMIEVSPLNILERTRSTALSRRSNVEEFQETKRRQDRFKLVAQRMEKAVARRDSHQYGTYERFVWSIICHQLCLAKEGLEDLLKPQDLTEEDQVDEMGAIAQIDEAAQILRRAGGELLPVDDAGNNSTVIQTAVSHTQSLADISDPWETFMELEALSLSSAVDLITGNYRGYHQSSAISVGQQAKILNVIQMSWIGDASLSTKKASMQCKICVVDSCGVTPLFAASFAGCPMAFTVIYEAASEQFRRFVEKRKRMKILKEDSAVETQVSRNIVKDQLRRLNNLDIAAGDVPRGGGPTPDMIRERLDAAEEAALKQASVVFTKEEDTEDDGISSSVPPETLLLYRSVVLPHKSEFPQLLEVQKKLLQMHPSSFPDDFVGQPVRLRPIEVALLRGDVEMLKTIRSAVFESASQKSGEAGDEAAQVSVVSADEFRGNRLSEDDSCCNDSVDNRVASPEQLGTSKLSPLHLRYLLYGDGSRNPDLNVTLTQLAIALDDTDAFIEIAQVAREHLLPRAAVGVWKKQIDEREKLTDAEKQSRDDLTRIIMGDFGGYGSWRWRVPLWAPDARSSNSGSSETMHVHPTLIQIALSFNAKQITRYLLSSKANEMLTGWIFRKEEHMFFEKTEKLPESCLGLEEAGFAAKWLCKHVSEAKLGTSEVSLKLFSVWTPDSIGRSALFYSPAELIEEVTSSASDMAGGVPLSSFLDAVTTKGSVTALMAAASAKQSDRVEALVKTGCTRHTTCGPNGWGPVHMALPSPGMASHTKIGHDNASLWASSRKIIGSILAGATISEVVSCLLCPEAEHSPLLVAIDRGADSDTISYLVQQMGENASQGLAARDDELNTLLHHAVSSSIPESVEFLLKQPRAPPELGPNVENAHGTTPFEVALASVAAPWSRSTTSKAQQLTVKTSERRQQLFRGALPPKLDAFPPDFTETTERQLLSLLHGVRSGKGRTAVDFESVKEVRKGAAAKARNASAGQSNEEQSYPSGNPMVLPVYRKPYRNSFYGNQEPLPWSGWPTIF